MELSWEYIIPFQTLAFQILWENLFYRYFGRRARTARVFGHAVVGLNSVCTPGPITSTHFRGSNRLLYQGAQVLLDPLDFLVDRGFDAAHDKTRKGNPPERWASLYEALDDVKDATVLASELCLPLSHVFAGLLELELDGWIVRKPGGFYVRSTAK